MIVSLSAAVLSGGITFREHINTWYYYAAFAFFSTFAVYNGQRIFKSVTGQETEWISWVRLHSRLIGIVATVASLVAVGLFSVLLSRPESVFLLVLLGTISVFYALKFKQMNLREVPYIKIYLIALVWVGTLIFFPLYNENIREDIILISTAHFLYVIAITIPFDIRDMKLDLPTQKTIPQVVGLLGAKIIALFLLLSFSLIMLYVDRGLWTNATFYLALGIQVLLILFMNEKRGDLYCAGGIDGSIALIGVSYFFS